jgi:hypothetical protein
MTSPTTPTPTDTPTQAPAQEPSATPPSWDDLFQGEDPAKVKKALEESRKWERYAKENKLAADKLAALEESQKSEAQKLADRAAQAERERDAAKLEALRVKVGAARKLPADVVDLLKGDTEEELAAHADRLSELFKKDVRPAGSVDQGVRGGAPAQNPRDAFADVIHKALGQ